MDDKKLDDLFQQELKNLAVKPNEKVWTTIEAKLKKKKRKVIPFWWFYGAVAAVFVLGFFLFPFSSDENTLENNFQQNTMEEIITSTPKNSPKNTTDVNQKIDSLQFDDNLTDEILIANTKKSPKKDTQNKVKNTVVNTNEIISKNDELSLKKRVQKINLTQNSVDVAFVSSTLNLSNDIDAFINKKNNAKKLDINDFVSEKEVLKNDESIKEDWSVAPVFGVLKSNSFSNTSPIDANLSNSTSGENSFSYGVQVAYKISKRWTIQSGIHMQEMNYSNNNISVISAGRSNLTATSFANQENFVFDKNFAESSALASYSLQSNFSNTGNLSQNFGYIEIPVEIKYNFTNFKKLETQFVTGFSSLFLNKNTVNLNLENTSRTGEATNLNNLNFSGNLGFDFNYLFNKNWSINVNPMLKVQLNTFSENANGFTPFNMGVYSGIIYRF